MPMLGLLLLEIQLETQGGSSLMVVCAAQEWLTGGTVVHASHECISIRFVPNHHATWHGRPLMHAYAYAMG
jgi:hypothetical protein